MQKRNKPIYKDKEFDSYEEIDFYQWCEEAVEYNVISKYEYQPEPFVLSEKVAIKVAKKLKTKTKIVNKHLFHPHVYTPDFIIYPTEGYKNIFENILISNSEEYYIDIKGSFQMYDGKRSFSINRKWIWDKYNIYINEVIPKSFFKLTWVPNLALYSPKNRKIRKKYKECKLIQEII